jgi:hypothetical protein
MDEDTLLRRACDYAEQDREAFVEAYSNSPHDPACVRAVEFLKELKAYRIKRWGPSSRDQWKAQLDTAPTVPVEGNKPKPKPRKKK